MPIKSTTTTEWEEKEKKIQKNLQNKSKHKNNKCFSGVTAVRVISLAGSLSPPHLPRTPSNTVLVSGPAVGADQTLTWSYSCVFFLWELSSSFYISHRHRVCPVDCVDLICSLPSWWEGLGSSSLATLPLGLNCGFISTSACGSSLGFAPEAALEDLGLPL